MLVDTSVTYLELNLRAPIMLERVWNANGNFGTDLHDGNSSLGEIGEDDLNLKNIARVKSE
jgi:hypothetical protein